MDIHEFIHSTYYIRGTENVELIVPSLPLNTTQMGRWMSTSQSIAQGSDGAIGCQWDNRKEASFNLVKKSQMHGLSFEVRVDATLVNELGKDHQEAPL